MQIRDALKRAGRPGHAGKSGDKLRVIVELEVRSPEEPHLAHLSALGLDVERVIGNKVLGVIAKGKLPALEADESVRAVEPSEKLKLHVPAAGA